MYDLVNDPNELNNIYDKSEFATTQKELLSELTNLRKYYGDSE